MCCIMLNVTKLSDTDQTVIPTFTKEDVMQTMFELFFLMVVVFGAFAVGTLISDYLTKKTRF